jgi:ATP-dependent exoDNAse (exonuclease V) alpha subunit
MAVNPWAKRLNNSVTAPDSQIKSDVRAAIAANAAADRIVDVTLPDVIPPEQITESHIEKGKLSKLVADDFPFDESQLAAIEGMIKEQYAGLTGAAGTGKTTTTKKLVDRLLNQEQIAIVDMRTYFKSEKDVEQSDESNQTFIPAVALVGFTGRSAQMIKKNFPRDWHGNIMTIHRLLAFTPEYYEDFDDGSGQYRTKMRFTPQYTADNRLPWDIIIIDEAGMVGLELWHQLWAAMKPGCRVYMIGDINQLPPVHGRSVFGFAMSKWPSFELTHIHRQAGANNAIVDNAWRILNGQMPISGGRFQMIELKGDAGYASRQVRAMVPKIQEKGLYDPTRDTIITPINGAEGSRGYALGQLPLNNEFALIFNPQSSHPRYIIDGGRERKQFAVGDKVMATKNDYEAGITNGMTGIITQIIPHPGYGGDHRRFGLVEDVNAYIAASDDEDNEDFTLEDLESAYEAQDMGREAAKEKKDRGPASHIVTVRFGEDQYAFDIDFATLSEVGSLMTAYVVTCHKMQGGESPTIIIICHDAHKAMLFREWLYTAVTRASERVILLYTPTALRTALNKQNIKGKTLKEKVHSFMLLQRDNGLGVSVNVKLPEPRKYGEEPTDDYDDNESKSTKPSSLDMVLGHTDSASSLPTIQKESSLPVQAAQNPRPNPLQALAEKAKAKAGPRPGPKVIREVHYVFVERAPTIEPTTTVTQIEDDPVEVVEQVVESIHQANVLALTDQRPWDQRFYQTVSEEWSSQPSTEPEPKPEPKPVNKFAALLAKKKESES